MISNKKAALPIYHPDGYGVLHLTDSGMDLRDYFAAQAMSALIIADIDYRAAIPELAYITADNMLAARSRNEE